VNITLPSGPPHHPPRLGAGVLPVFEYLHAVDEDVHHPRRILPWLIEGGVILDLVGIEDREIGVALGGRLAHRAEPARGVARELLGAPVELGPTEFRMLHFLMTHAERVHSRTQLLDQVWGDHVFVEERTVDVHIRRLRKALEPTGLDSLVQTVRGTGYRFSAG